MPTYAPSFTALGKLYESASPPDSDRALKCFQKAFELDATEAEAAEKLASGYADAEEWSLVRAIAMRVMESEGGVEGVKGGEILSGKERFAPKNGWAWKALGSTEMVSICPYHSGPMLMISIIAIMAKRHRRIRLPFEPPPMTFRHTYCSASRMSSAVDT